MPDTDDPTRRLLVRWSGVVRVRDDLDPGHAGGLFMSEELRAAAKRLLAEAVAYRENNGWPDHDYPELAADMESVSLVCLAEHPADDGEAVTEDWLRAEGFYYDDPGRIGSLRNRDGLQIRHDGMTFWLHPIVTSHTIYMPTRGHVRRLCAALDVTITPPG